MWPGVEPAENEYNSTYISLLEQLVNNGEKYGIYTLLDFHQDLFSEKFCADGVPKWAVQEPSWSILSFPRPVDLSAFPFDNQTGNPIGCEKHAWASYYFSYAVASNFQYLYDNTYGLMDKLGKFWTILADRFKNNTNIIGYELINEPFAGNVFKNPLLLIPGYADKHNLGPFYDKLND
jgi:endoglycosylceramidase